jgi:glycogen debranching enzyme
VPETLTSPAGEEFVLADASVNRRSVAFAYAGQDGMFRETRIAFDLEPNDIEVRGAQVVAEWRLRLEPTQTEMIALTVGRDSLLTCHQTLLLNPDLTRTTLEVLAAFQADEVDEWRDAQPGKILHELRQGELAGAGQIPHTPYYGSIDSTPLWLLLLGTYYRWTGDLEFCRRLLPNVERALEWVERYGDPDGDGFVEYRRSSPRGLANQGWKDSRDSVVHVDGKLAGGAEVQGYLYLAKLRLADVFEQLPGWLNTVELHDLRVGRSTISIVFQRHGETTGFSLLDKDGDVRVLMEE